MADCRLLFVVELEPGACAQQARWAIQLGRPADEETAGRILALNDEPDVVLAWLDRLCAAGRQGVSLMVVARSDPMLGILHALEVEDSIREVMAGGGQPLGRVQGTVEEIAAALTRWLGEERDARPGQQSAVRKRIAIA